MYNCQVNLLKKIFLWSVVLLVSQCQVFWFDLTEEIAWKYYNEGLADKYMSRMYSPDFSKDPFWDAVSNVEDMSMQLKVAWAQYVQQALVEKNCPLSNKKIWAILYYYVPEFRSEFVRAIKTSIWNYDNKKYVFEEDVIMKYCSEYFMCEKSQWYSALQVFWEEGIKWNDLRWISASTPEDIKTNCK